MMLTACSGQVGDEQRGNDGPENGSSGLVATNQIVFGISWEPIGFYPIRAIDSGSYYAQTLVYEGLVKYDAASRIVPALADEYTVSADALTYRFRLRKNLHFSDGSPITGADVEASFKVATQAGSPFRGDYQDISSVDAIGEDVFVIHLSSPNAALLSRLVELRILPAKYLKQADGGRVALSRTPISSGPFILTKWECGVELIFAANPHYWGEKPHIERLIWRVIPDRILLALCLNRGEIDVAPVDAQSWKGLKLRHSRLVLDRFAGSRTIYLGFNLSREPFDRLRLRQAICSGIDRKKIIENLFCGFGRLPASDVPSGSWAFNQAALPRQFDPSIAREELQQVEQQIPSKEISFRILTLRDFQDLAQAVSYDLKNIGIKNEVQIVEYTTLRKRFLQSGNFSTVIWSRSAGPDPECGIVWGSGGPLNFCRFKNATVDELLRAGRRTADRKQRAAIYQEMQKILAEQLPWIFLCQPELLLAHSPHCLNIKRGDQQRTGLPWDNPLFNACSWERDDVPFTRSR
jgi:peptide/nickel transport system substrate-binding protein